MRQEPQRVLARRVDALLAELCAVGRERLSAWTPTTRQGEYWRGELAFNNRASAIWATVTNLAVLQQGGDPDLLTNPSGNVFLPQPSETFWHDADGNLTNDGL